MIRLTLAIVTAFALASLGGQPIFEDSCNCTQGDPWLCGYHTFQYCIQTRSPMGCETDCCDECYEECEIACIERSITCDWSATEFGNCISGCQRAYECFGCAGPPPPGCP